MRHMGNRAHGQHVPHTPCIPYPLYHITPVHPLPMCPNPCTPYPCTSLPHAIAHVPIPLYPIGACTTLLLYIHCPCAPTPVPHTPCISLPHATTHVPHTPVPHWPLYYMNKINQNKTRWRWLKQILMKTKTWCICKYKGRTLNCLEATPNLNQKTTMMR